MLARGWRLKAILASVALAGLGGEALARGSRRTTAGYETVDLATVRSNPKAFMGKRISFDCFFASLGRIYQPFQTPFVAEQYLNFHVWGPGTRLWDNRERRNAFLFCFIPRDLEKPTNYIMRRSMYESLRLFGKVTVVYADQPWFELDDVEPSAMPAISEIALRHIMVGIKSLRNEDFAMAQESFEEAIKVGLPKDARDFAQRELGSAYYELGIYRDAAARFKLAASTMGDDPWILLRWGQSLSRAADEQDKKKLVRRMLRDAMTQLNKARKLEPANPDAHAEIGWVKAKLGERLDGILDVRRALALKASAPSYRILGRIYILLGRLDDADNAYNNAIVHDPLNPLYHREVADLIYMPLGRYDDAEDEYKNLIGLTETEPDGYIRRAGTRLKQDKIDGAIEDYKSALRKDRDNIDALVGLAAIHRDRGEYEDARANLAQAAKLAPKNVKVLVAHAEVLLAQKEYDDAVGAYNNILKMKLRDPLAPVHHGLGVALAKRGNRGDLALASKELGLAVRADSDNVKYRKDYADVLSDQGQHARVVQELEHVKRLAPADERARLLLAKARGERGDLKGQRSELEEAIRIIPDSVWAMNNLAAFLADHGKAKELERAEKLVRAAYEKDPANADFQDTLGWIKYKQGNLDEARDLLDLAAMRSKAPEPYYHLAKVLKELEGPESARKPVEDALRKLQAITAPGVATRRFLQKVTRFAGSIGANPRPGPKTSEK